MLEDQSSVMNKTLSKAVMLRTKLRNKFLKNRTNENKTNYVKQRKHCVSLLRKAKRKYYINLEEKTYWITRHFEKLLNQCYLLDIETIQVLLQLRSFVILNLIFRLKLFNRKKLLKNQIT